MSLKNVASKRVAEKVPVGRKRQREESGEEGEEEEVREQHVDAAAVNAEDGRVHRGSLSHAISFLLLSPALS